MRQIITESKHEEICGNDNIIYRGHKDKDYNPLYFCPFCGSDISEVIE